MMRRRRNSGNLWRARLLRSALLGQMMRARILGVQAEEENTERDYFG
jgi:hypothetical protein